MNSPIQSRLIRMSLDVLHQCVARIEFPLATAQVAAQLMLAPIVLENAVDRAAPALAHFAGQFTSRLDLLIARRR